jgi:putative ABC transport system ATP-binding protein
MHSTIPLIELKNIEKVFLTDELETHASSGVNLEIRHGDYVSTGGLA